MHCSERGTPLPAQGAEGRVPPAHNHLQGPALRKSPKITPAQLHASFQLVVDCMCLTLCQDAGGLGQGGRGTQAPECLRLQY